MAAGKMENESKPLDFETAMRDLEQIVERLEHGDLPLEESLAAFERGVILTRSCQTALKEAEQRVEILLKNAGGAQVDDFDPDETKGEKTVTSRLTGGAATRCAGVHASSDMIELRGKGTMSGFYRGTRKPSHM